MSKKPEPVRDSHALTIANLTPAAGGGLIDLFGPDGPGLQLSKPPPYSHSPKDDQPDGAGSYDPLCLLTVERVYLEERVDAAGKVDLWVELVGVEAEAGRVTLPCGAAMAASVLRPAGVPYEILSAPGGDSQIEAAQTSLQDWWNGRILVSYYTGRTPSKTNPGRKMKRFDLRVFETLDLPPAEAKTAIREMLGAGAAAVKVGVLPSDADAAL